MRTTTTTALMLALSCATVACARVEAEVPEAEVTQKAVSFQAVPGGSALGEVSITQSFTISADDLSWAKDLNSEVYATAVEIKLLGDVKDLSFIHYARVLMSDGAADSSTAPVEVISYQRPDGMAPTDDLLVKTNYPIDVTKVWASKKITITLQLAGVLPEQAWSADITLHMGGKMSYKF